MQCQTVEKRTSLDLVLGPVGSGKSSAAVARFCECPGESLLVVTTKAQADWLSLRVEHACAMPSVEARARILPWSSLISEILRSDRGMNRAPISRPFQRILLSTLVPATIREDDFLGKMLFAPGFVSALQESIREWKLAGATPAAFGVAAQRAEKGGTMHPAAKMGEIERLFSAYERFLQENGLCDEEDSLHRAAELLTTGVSVAPKESRRIIVHGFYRFTAAQHKLLVALAESATLEAEAEPALTITLPWEERRPLLFAAPGRTLAQLRTNFETRESRLPNDGPGKSERSQNLLRLSRDLFTEKSQAAHENTEGFGTDASIQIIEAPNSYVETEMVAREFRRLHERLNIPWHEFAVILRSSADYAPILSSVFERYEVPIAAQVAENCAGNPLLKTVLSLLDVVRNGWRREDVLAFLKSSYTLPDSIEVDRLRQQAATMAILEGREHWLALVGAGAPTGSEARDWEPTLTAAVLDMARIDDLLNDRPADTAYFARVVGEIIATFGLEGRIAKSDRARMERDKSALRTGMATIDALVRMAEMRSAGILPFSAFHALLRDAWENSIAYPEHDGDQVCVIEPHASRERPIRICAVMGLTERVFPRRVSEDPFVRDEERCLLREWTGVELEEQKLRADDERFLFYLAATAPTDRLLLSFPRAAHENDTLPSFFLEEVRAVFEGDRSVAGARSEDGDSVREPAAGIEVVVRTLADVAPRPSETANTADVLLSACADLFDPQCKGERRRERALEGAGRIESLLRGTDCESSVRAVLRSRNLPKLPALLDPWLRERFVTAKPTFTVRELETYGRCPFRYLLRHVWNIKAEVEGLDNTRQSALVHSVLRRYFRSRSKANKPGLRAVDTATVFADLKALLWASLQDARLNVGRHHIQILHRRLNDDLMGFAVREVRYAEQFGAVPSRFHLSFGRAPIAVPPDPSSCAKPLIIEGAGGEGSVAISGFIDRVDLDETGSKAVIVEYEVGVPPEFAAIQRGDSLQMPIHLLAIERLFGLDAAGACYDSMQETGRRRFHRAEHVNVRRFGPVMPFDQPSNVKPLSREQYADLVTTAQASVLRLAGRIATGRVDASPGPHCRGCEFRDVCRTTVIDGHDGKKPISLPTER